MALLQMELDVDRIVLRDRYDRSAGAYIGADAEGDVTEAAVVGRSDLGILKQDLIGRQLGLVAVDRRRSGISRRDGLVQRLLRARAVQQAFGACEGRFCLGQGCLILGQRRLVLVDRGLGRARIELGDEVAGFDHGAVLSLDRDDDAGFLRCNRRRILRVGPAGGGDVVGQRRFRDGHGLDDLGAAWRLPWLPASVVFVLSSVLADALSTKADIKGIRSR